MSSDSWWDLLSHLLIFYWAWALLTPAVFVVGRRLGLVRPEQYTSAALVALAAAVPVIAIHGLIYLAAHHLTFGSGFDGANMASYIMRHGLGDLATYAVLIGGHLGVQSYLKGRKQELAASQLAQRGAELEAQLSQAQLEVLKMQLQPHFLFNVLNTISVLVMKGEAIAANRTLGQISELLRSTIALGGRPVIPLSEELALAQRYLELERIRFGDRLTFELEVDPEVLVADVPSLVLQPVVENAIRHGIGASPLGGKVVLSAMRAGNRLRLQVRDEGPGLSHGSSGSTGIGLANTRARLEQMYGVEATLIVEDGPQGGAVATIDIPFNGDEPRNTVLMSQGAAAN